MSAMSDFVKILYTIYPLTPKGGIHHFSVMISLKRRKFLCKDFTVPNKMTFDLYEKEGL